MGTKKLYTISAYTENSIGILSRLSTIFVRRYIGIDSFTSSESEIENVFRFVIVINTTEKEIKKIMGQIEKQVDVIKAFYHTDEETIYQESALYKMKTEVLFENYDIQKIIKKHNATYVTASKAFFIIEKTGIRKEINALYEALKPYEILQFVRSGRISVSKTPMNIRNLLKS